MVSIRLFYLMNRIILVIIHLLVFTSYDIPFLASLETYKNNGTYNIGNYLNYKKRKEGKEIYKSDFYGVRVPLGKD